MSSEFDGVGLIDDTATVAAICAEVSSSGSLLVCNGCRDIEAPIAGVLVIDHDEEAWALCGACIRRLPLERTVV